ncbi:MAG: hypothetical protein ACPG47_00420 [Leucothrix sp.]
MKKTAIQFALYLHMHPEKGLEQWYLMRALPDGMLALLQAASSKKKRNELAETIVFDEQEMKQAFIKFLLLILEGFEHSPYRGLAAREKTSLERCLLHKKLLLNIFHPDKMQQGKPYILQQVQDSYEQVKVDHAIPLYHSSAPEDALEPPQNQENQFGSVKVNNAPRPSSAYRRQQQKKHINYVLMCGIFGLVLASFLVVLIVPSTPQSIVRQDPVAPNQNTGNKTYITLAGNRLSPIAPATPVDGSNSLSPFQNDLRVRLLINELEAALEDDLISELQFQNPSPQSSKQMTDLFISADQKKVFLHSFLWKPVPSGLHGEGKFLSRFQFAGRGKWVTRTGKFFIDLSEQDAQLHIKQFHFEDNLH